MLAGNLMNYNMSDSAILLRLELNRAIKTQTLDQIHFNNFLFLFLFLFINTICNHHHNEE